MYELNMTVGGHVAAIAIGAVLSALLLAVEHWYPYPRELRILERYVLGSAAVLVGFTVAHLLLGDIWTPIGLAAIYAASGGIVGLAYWLDDYNLKTHKVGVVERNDTELTI